MATAIHNAGPAIIKVGPALATSTTEFGGGSLTSPSTLGITEPEGTDIELENHIEPVYDDVGGPNCPIDVQEFGKTARVTLRLPVYDSTVLISLRKRADTTTEGGLPTIGKLISTGGYDKRLIIASANSDEIWRFWHSYLVGSQRVKQGTRRSIWTLTFFCWAFISTGTTSKDVILYDHTDA